MAKITYYKNDCYLTTLYSGAKFWYKNHKKHRENGPAIEYSNGDKAWYYEGEFIGSSWHEYTQEKFETWKRFKAFL